MAKLKLCPDCQEKFRKISAKGGKAGSHAAKVKAGRKGGIKRRENFHRKKLSMHGGEILSAV